ncbi:hypothetical protein QBC46DRAFT_399463 [Diplogelasinospora grovesii]|uniref:Uncharacterized protein n=1 Tax=Diplogelasinospora grovesii TaxID=303347 RepID=A0AAN6MWW5_9PEZI|nr:hypothetical protein QBC46DRAFT_399463 [Diplogelasinospora grovesii]
MCHPLFAQENLPPNNIFQRLIWPIRGCRGPCSPSPHCRTRSPFRPPLADARGKELACQAARRASRLGPVARPVSRTLRDVKIHGIRSKVHLDDDGNHLGSAPRGDGPCSHASPPPRFLRGKEFRRPRPAFCGVRSFDTLRWVSMLRFCGKPRPALRSDGWLNPSLNAPLCGAPSPKRRRWQEGFCWWPVPYLSPPALHRPRLSTNSGCRRRAGVLVAWYRPRLCSLWTHVNWGYGTMDL